MSSKPASANRGTDQKMARRVTKAVMSHARVILLNRDLYVFLHTTSDGGGATCAIKRDGEGSKMACTAICFMPSAHILHCGQG